MGKTSDRGGTYLLPRQKTLQTACGNRSGGDSVPISTLVNSLFRVVARLFLHTRHSVVLLLPGGEWAVNLFSIRVDVLSVITTRTISAGKNRAVCVDAFALTRVRRTENPCDTRHLHPTRFSVRFGGHPRIRYLMADRGCTAFGQLADEY